MPYPFPIPLLRLALPGPVLSHPRRSPRTALAKVPVMKELGVLDQPMQQPIGQPLGDPDQPLQIPSSGLKLAQLKPPRQRASSPPAQSLP